MTRIIDPTHLATWLHAQALSQRDGWSLISPLNWASIAVIAITWVVLPLLMVSAVVVGTQCRRDGAA